MTKPAFISFSYDRVNNSRPLPKIFICTLLYSTGKRGHVVENMYLTVRNGGKQKQFNVWGHGDEKLSRGSGLFVGETGIAANHHFNPVSGSADFEFVPGNYEAQIFATLPGRKKTLHLHTLALDVPQSLGLSTENANTAIWFEWQRDERCYHAHAETRS